MELSFGPRPDSEESPPVPLLSRRHVWAIASLGLAVTALVLFGVLMIVFRFSSSIPLGVGVALLSLACGLAGVIAAGIGLFKREGPAALLALIVSGLAMLPASPIIPIALLLVATSD